MIWINAGEAAAEHESFVRSDSIPLPLSALDNARFGRPARPDTERAPALFPFGRGSFVLAPVS